MIYPDNCDYRLANNSTLERVFSQKLRFIDAHEKKRKEKKNINSITILSRKKGENIAKSCRRKCFVTVIPVSNTAAVPSLCGTTEHPAW